MMIKKDSKGIFAATLVVLISMLSGLMIHGQAEFGTLDLSDYNGDGSLDLLFCNNMNNGIAGIADNNGSGDFTLTGLPLDPHATSAGWADLNNDGFLDYYSFASGLNACELYYNRGDGSYIRSGQFSSQNWLDPDVTVIDYDQDADPDLFVTGWDVNASRRYSKIFRNRGRADFEETDLQLIEKGFGSASWADVDGNNTPDLLLNGDGDAYGDGGSYDIYRLYLNDGNGTFTEKQVFNDYRQISVGDGSRFVDWDNDGDFDIILTGWSNTENRQATCVFLNDGSGSFTRSAESDVIPGVSESSIEVADINEDDKTDLILTGYSGDYGRRVALVYLNETSESNSRPMPPGNLNTMVGIDSVIFSWDKGSDPETPDNALSYNIYLKDLSSDRWIIYPRSKTTLTNNGRRESTGMGNVNMNDYWKLYDLPVGKYAWSVQSIDAAYAGSIFPEEIIFAVKDTAYLNQLILDAQTAVDTSVAGTGIGNVPAGSISNLQDSINKVEPWVPLLAKTQEEIATPILTALDAFLASRIGVDTRDLAAEIEEATELADTVATGNRAGEYPPSALDQLNAAIADALQVKEDAENISDPGEIAAQQTLVDNELQALSQAISDFLGTLIVLDLEALNMAVDSALYLYENMPTGNDNGAFPPEAKLDLALAVEHAVLTAESKVTQQMIDDELAALYDAIDSFWNTMVVIDFEKLGALLDSANLLHDEADVADYLPGAKFDLKKAITDVSYVYNNARATQQEVTDAIAEMEQAIAEFLASKISRIGASGMHRIRIFPNPARDQINLEGLKENTHIRLLDATGMEVYSRVEIPGTAKLDVSHLVPGLYFLHIREEGLKSFCTKIMIQ